MENKVPAVLSTASKEVSLNREVILQSQEMAGIAVAASARAEVETAYALAIKKPRSEDVSRRKILDVCMNLKFAESAKYKKPQGNKKVGNNWVTNYIEGASIRFAEEALRLWGNIKTMQSTIYDDPAKRVIKVTVIDLETNLSYSKEFLIEKTVERKNAIGREVVSERLNSANERVFIVTATEDEIANKEAANASKTIRNNGLRLIPDYVISEALEVIDATVKAGVDKDPDAAKRMIVDNFAKIRVMPNMIEEYLGHSLDTTSPSEIVELKQLFTTIHEGNTNWNEVMESRKGEAKTAEVVSMDAPKADLFKAGDPKDHASVSQPLK